MQMLDDRLVRDIALDVPGAVRAFEAHHLDYCCGGGRTLRDACTSAGVRLDDVVADIENQARHARARGEGVDLAAMSVEAIVDRVVRHHHVLVERENERLRALAHDVLRKHGDAHVELHRIVQLVDQLFAELLPHQAREEMVLFPHILELARAARDGSPLPRAPFPTIAAPLAVMEDEHESVSALLDALRAGCDGFRPPEGACASWRALYQGAEEIERDLMRHVHVENNVLFPRARALEAKLRAP
jgi:regulator of cell morphogenesis and NO signaling